MSQTDWSGGPGIIGPVNTWTDVFCSVNYLDFSSIPGSLSSEKV